MLESEIRNKVRDWAKANGWLAYVFTSPSKRSVPDRIYIKDGRVVFIEYKLPGEKLTPGQKREIERLRAAGAEVHVAYSVGGAIMILLGFM
jgi:hypothetical protein